MPGALRTIGIEPGRRAAMDRGDADPRTLVESLAVDHAALLSRVLPGLGDATLARLEEAGRLNYTATRSRRGRAPKGVLRVGIAEMLTPAQQLEDPFYLYLSGFVRQGCLDRKYTAVPLESRGEGFLTPEGEALDGIIAIGKFRSGQIAALESICPQIVF